MGVLHRLATGMPRSGRSENGGTERERVTPAVNRSTAMTSPGGKAGAAFRFDRTAVDVVNLPAKSLRT